MSQPPQTKRATAAPDYIAPDGSEIRTLPATERGSMAHCTLPVGVTTKAVAHRTVEEFWYFLEGEGEVWRDTSDPPVTPVSAGVSLTIPTGTQFQFRNTGDCAAALRDRDHPAVVGRGRSLPRRRFLDTDGIAIPKVVDVLSKYGGFL